MVNDFKKNANKTQLFPSFHTVDQQKNLNNFKTHWGPSTHVLGMTSPDPNPYATSQVEAFGYILSYLTLQTDKKLRSY